MIAAKQMRSDWDHDTIVRFYGYLSRISLTPAEFQAADPVTRAEIIAQFKTPGLRMDTCESRTCGNLRRFGRLYCPSCEERIRERRNAKAARYERRLAGETLYRRATEIAFAPIPVGIVRFGLCLAWGGVIGWALARFVN